MHWTRAQLNKAEPGKGDEHFKCEELKSYVEPAERVKAALRQGLVQNCERAIKAALWDPGSYVFVDHLYVANEINGVDVRLTYLKTTVMAAVISGKQPAATSCDQTLITCAPLSFRLSRCARIPHGCCFLWPLRSDCGCRTNSRGLVLGDGQRS